MSTSPWKSLGTTWSTLWDYGPGPWVERALCAQVDTEIFFPEKRQSSIPAKRICLRCEVKQDCLSFALDHNIKEGVWGGKSERQRKEMHSRRRSA